jgi:CcmD family protein
MGYLFVAYAVFWGLTFAFVLRTEGRQRRLERQLQDLRQAMDQHHRQQS